jgi:putative flippase GtrA
LVGAYGVPAAEANVIATAVGTVPSFELNRRWVWARGGVPALRREILPFCALSFLSLAWSTLAVHFGASWADAHHYHRLERTVVVEVANVTAFGSAWVGQFVLCDRVLFRGRTPRETVIAHAPDDPIDAGKALVG